MIPRTMTTDEGYFNKTEDLPIMAISLSGSGFQNLQYQYHTVGPLLCYQGQRFHSVYFHNQEFNVSSIDFLT